VIGIRRRELGVRLAFTQESVELVARWAREQPINNPLFVREPVAPLAAKALFSGEAGLGDALASAKISMQQLSVRTSVASSLAPSRSSGWPACSSSFPCICSPPWDTTPSRRVWPFFEELVVL